MKHSALDVCCGYNSREKFFLLHKNISNGQILEKYMKNDPHTPNVIICFTIQSISEISNIGVLDEKKILFKSKKDMVITLPSVSPDYNGIYPF